VGPPRPPESPVDALRKLQAVTDAALAHLALDELLDELLTRIREALEADTCAVLLLDESGDLVARAAKGLEEEVEQRLRIPVGQGFAGRIAATQQPVVIEDVDHSEVLSPILRDKGVKSLLGVPLIAGDQILGVVHVGTLVPRVFAEPDILLLQLVAQRAALAIDRALVYDEVIRLGQVQRDFVALAAHELRTPATAVYGLAATLRERRAQLEPATVEELQEALYEQADRMQRLVDQLLDLSRLDARTVKIRRARVALRPHLEQIVRSMAPDPGEVTLEVPSDLEAFVDAVAVEHVISNLVSNALRHGALPVKVSAEQKDRYVRIAVEDRGEGVHRDFIPFLFDRFRRGERSRQLVMGTGLGLAIARSYAVAHGGDLVYTPGEPSGARFELVLPADPANG
jgi:signal transduction histidine kinase